MAGTDLLPLSFDTQLEREWLVTNGLGGYASSTIPGLNTRKYHGLLVAALSPPLRQMVILSRVEDSILHRGQSFPLASCEYPGVISPQGHRLLRAFNPDPFPRWAYQGDGWTIEKQLRLLPGENTVCLSYTLLGGAQLVDLEINPLFALRGMHELMYQWNGRLSVESSGKGTAFSHHRIPATNRSPEVFFAHEGRFEAEPEWYLNTIYRCEAKRGYAGLEDLWRPGTVRWTLQPGQAVHFACSTDPIDLGRIVSVIAREDSSNGHAVIHELERDCTFDALVRAANQFIVRGTGRGGEAGAESETHVIAGYPWMPDSGRDSLIAFAGLFLTTHRFDEAKSLLQRYALREERGLIRAEWSPESATALHYPADVSLWFVNAVWQYLRYSGDATFVIAELFPAIESILRHFQDGTTTGVRVDVDGLICSDEPGSAPTWMDAKLGEWVITPRMGRAVEVNALWFNALSIAAVLARTAGQETCRSQWLADAETTRIAFNQRFWNADLQCCYDVVGDAKSDAAIRPNQLLAISLAFPVLAVDRRMAVLNIVRSELLTSCGLRTLSAKDANYRPIYSGTVFERDRAYHQGTVFPWLLGPYISALVKVNGRTQAVRDEAFDLIKGCLSYLNGNGLGQLCELFDGNPPRHPGGLRASARSVGEVLRCYVENVLNRNVSASAPDDGAAVRLRADVQESPVWQVE